MQYQPTNRKEVPADARRKTLALYIYAFCQPREWDVTISEIAEGIGADIHMVQGICHREKWFDRLRNTKREFFSGGTGRGWCGPESLMHSTETGPAQVRMQMDA